MPRWNVIDRTARSHKTKLADRILPEVLPQPTVHRKERSLQRFHEKQAIPLRRAQNHIQFCLIEHRRLLTKHMFARSERHQRIFLVAVRMRRNVDRVNRLLEQ